MKPALVLGGAACVWSDIAAFKRLTYNFDVIAAKRIAAAYPGPLRAFASLHPNTVQETLDARRAAGYDMSFDIFVDRAPERPTFAYSMLADLAGSSGLYAVHVALRLGYTRIVLAGVPMNDSPHFDKSSNWTFVYSYRKGWDRNKALISKHVRSMSGWTKANYGAPTAEWLRSET